MRYYERLRDMREDRDLSQAEVAEILQIRQSDYSKYELGKHMMGIDKYLILASYYNVSLDYLTGLVDTPSPLIPPKSLSSHDLELIRRYKASRYQAAVDRLLEME